MPDNDRNHLAAEAPAARRGPVQHRQLLDAIAASVPFDELPQIEAATVTRLLRAVPWYERHDQMSLLATYYPTLAARAARVIHQCCPGARVVSLARRPGRETRKRFELLVPAAAMNDITVWLHLLWQAASRRVTASTRHDLRVAAARTMWRAALLVASSDRNRAQLRVRVPHSAVVHTLAEAGRALHVEVKEHRGQSGYHFITVDDPADAVRLLRAVGAGSHADAWVVQRKRVSGHS
jgi:hypothetical protein